MVFLLTIIIFYLAVVSCPTLPAPPSAVEQGWARLVHLGSINGPCKGRSSLEGDPSPSCPRLQIRVDEEAVTSDDFIVARVRVGFENVDNETDFRTLVTLSQPLSIYDISVIS